MIPSQSIEQFLQDGYLVVPALISDEQIDSALAAIDDIESQPVLHDQRNLRARMKTHPQSGEALLDSVDPVLDLSSVWRDIALDPKITALMRALYGEEAHLFKDKIILKKPGMSGYPFHQDFISWPLFPKSFTTVMIALDATDEQNGCLQVVRGSHTKGYLSPKDGDFHDLALSGFEKRDVVSVSLNAGDAVIFGAFTVHGSGPNQTNAARRQLYLSYNKTSDGGYMRESHYKYFHAWLKRRYSEYGQADWYFA